jgi:molybdopterin-containing oxidoreductase family membrane subunit
MTPARVAHAAGGLLFLFGAWGLYGRLVHGHLHAGYGSYVMWGLWVAMYLFFAGVAAGAFMMATLDFLFHVRAFRGTGRLALWVSLCSLAAGLLLIGLDLGHLERFWRVYLHGNPGSLMFQMVWGYTLFGLVLAGVLYLAVRSPEGRPLHLLLVTGVGLLLALFVSGAVGALLGVLANRPFWHVGLFPVQFPVFSLASGMAAMLVALAFFGPRDDPRLPDQLWLLSLGTVVLALVKLYFLWADFSQSIYGNIPENVRAVKAVLFGPYWWVFWVLQLVLGTLVPMAVLARPGLARRPAWAGWMGVLVLVGYAVARLNIIIPALAFPELRGLDLAYREPRLTFTYFPSLEEWQVLAFALSVALALFCAGWHYLPLMAREGDAGRTGPGGERNPLPASSQK